MVAERRAWNPSEGAFGDLTMGIQWLLTVQIALVVAVLPTAAVFLLLERHPSNLIIYALAALPVGPAVQAAVYALREGPRADDARPWRRFWHGWRSGGRQSLAVWTPAMALLGFALFNAAYAEQAGVAAVIWMAGLAVAAAVTVWAVAALTVIAAFQFRTRDLGRVTLYALGARPLSALGVLALAFVAAALVAFTFDAVLVLLAALFAYGLLATVRPMLEVVRTTFVDPPEST